jgi:hypothetical protein
MCGHGNGCGRTTADGKEISLCETSDMRFRSASWISRSTVQKKEYD